MRTEHRSKSPISNGDELQPQTQRTEHRSKSLIMHEQHKDKMHTQTGRTEHRSKLLILHKEDWQQDDLMFRRMRHYNDRKQHIKWQQSLMLQVAHTYIISLVGYGM
jgi:hypothetical protein